MSVEQSDIVDFISISKATGNVVLTISDHLSWEDEPAHLALLQTKINSYFAFIESGQLVEEYSDAKERFPVISIRGMHEPSSGALQFFSKIKQVAKDAGIGFQFEHAELQGELRDQV